MHSDVDSGDWRSVLAQWKIGLLTAIVLFAAACAILLLLTPLYRASVQLVLPLSFIEDPADRKSAAPQQADTFVVKSFSDLITDDGISRTVIRDLHLAQAPEFQPRTNWLTDRIADLNRYLMPEGGTSPFSKQELADDRVLQLYGGRLKAKSDGKALTVLLSFDAEDPHLAAKVVTAHARAFVQSEVDHRRREYDTKVRWMKAELDRTAAEARDAQVAIQLNPTSLSSVRSTSAEAVSELKMRQLQATGTQAVYDSVLKRYQDMVADQTYAGSGIRIVSDATLPTHPNFPRKMLSAAVAALVSLVSGVAAAAMASVMRRRVSLESMVAKVGAPVLARINVPGLLWSARGPTSCGKRLLFWQRIHELRSAIGVTGRRHPILMVTSLLPGEGKSLLASALARTLAGSGLRTLLIDVNGRNARYQASIRHDNNGEINAVGLQDYLEGWATAKQVAVQVDGAPLFLMTSRAAAGTDLAAVSGGKLRSRLTALKKDFDAIVIDAPALDGLSDALQIAEFTDEVLLAVDAGNGRLDRLEDDVARIRARSGRLKGIVVVDRTPPSAAELAPLRGYALQEPLREVWPKGRRMSRLGALWPWKPSQKTTRLEKIVEV